MNKISLNLIFALLAISMVSTAHASLNQFIGQWENINSNTQGVTKINISNVAKNGVMVRAWGKCHLKNCDWGRVKSYVYGENVSSNINSSAEAISAIFNTKFSQSLVIIHSKGKRLQVEVLTHFTDKSKRTAYKTVYTFVRANKKHSPIFPAPRQFSPRNTVTF